MYERARCELWVLVGVWDVGACLRCGLATIECSGASWTGFDVEEWFGVCVRCVTGWSDGAACMGVV